MLNVIFGRFFLNLTLSMTKLRALVLSFPDFMDISNMLKDFGFFYRILLKIIFLHGEIF